MIVAISYHDGDLDLMTRWARHIVKLGPYLNHHLVLLPAHGAASDGIERILGGSFSKLSIEVCHHTEIGWPISCNRSFEAMAWAANQKYKQPFLWMEPDAVPLVKGWLNDIENAYNEKGRPFMGDFVAINGVMPHGVDHMSGIAVYHHDMPRLAPSIFNNDRIAWDIASANAVTRQMHRTNLIHHDWVPTKEWRREFVNASCVRSGAVIYHPDKKGILFNDGLVPNGAEGDLQTGAVVVDQKPHETKDTAKDYKGEIVTKSFPVIDPWKDIIDYAKTSPKNKKAIINRLIQEGILPKAKRAKQSGKKVRSVVGAYKGAGS